MTQQESRKSRFIKNNELKKINLGNNDWVKIPKKLAYKDLKNFHYVDENNEQMERVISFIIQFIKEWNLIEENGEVAPIDKEHVELLSIEDINKIADEAEKLINIPKVESAQSNEPLKE